MSRTLLRIGALQFLLALGGLAVLWRAVAIQVVDHRAWQHKAEDARVRTAVVAARRGAILDRNGVPLAQTHEQYQLRLTRSEMRDTGEVAIQRLLVQAGISPERVTRAFQRDYPSFPEFFSAEAMQPFRGRAGVHPDARMRRVYPLQRVGLAWLGRLDDQGQATGGIERAWDTLLLGTPGKARYLLDGRGRAREVPQSVRQAPVAGHNVYLTIDNELQGIVEGVLYDAVDSMPAQGGDVVILEARTGEILAMASLRRNARGEIEPNAAAVTEPGEPGSTAKIFTAAAVLEHGVDTTPVPGHHGRWVTPGTTRVIEDVHGEDGDLTLGETIKHSSNVAISQFALRLSPEQLFRTLRGFGFGTQTGIGFPGEDGGLLFRPPWVNHLLSMPSLSQGYEFMATSLQVATGYAVLANDGVLVAPTLVREIRHPSDPTPIWQHAPQPLRRVVSTQVASRLRDYLRLATDTGSSGRRAQLDQYTVIGKTATAKVRPYLPGVYRSAFAGLWPGDDPQLVIYVMVDRPQGGRFYGGDVAAPLVRSIMLRALAATNSPLNRTRLALPVASLPPVPVPSARAGDATPVLGVELPHMARTGEEADVVVPDLTGLSLREAVAAMHQAGLRVRLRGTGQPTGSVPGAGTTVTRGTTVALQLSARR